LGEGGKKKEKPPIVVSREIKDQKISFTRSWEYVGKSHQQKTKDWMAMMFWHSLDPIQVSGKMIRDHKEKL
jgi:hypothetical protein